MQCIFTLEIPPTPFAHINMYKMPGSCQRLRLPSLVATSSTSSATSSSSSSAKNDKTSSEYAKLKEQHRVVMMGSAKVGKSSIISQFLYDKYLTRYRETVEELHRGEYELPDGASLTLDILDTSGAFQFPAMRALSISTSGAFILVYAVDDARTWEEVESLRKQVIIYVFLIKCRFFLSYTLKCIKYPIYNRTG